MSKEKEALAELIEEAQKRKKEQIKAEIKAELKAELLLGGDAVDYEDCYQKGHEDGYNSGYKDALARFRVLVLDLLNKVDDIGGGLV